MTLSLASTRSVAAVAGDGHVVVDGAAGGRVAEFGARDDVFLRQLRDEHAAFCGEGDDGEGRGLAVVVPPHSGPGGEGAFPVFRSLSCAILASSTPHFDVVKTRCCMFPFPARYRSIRRLFITGPVMRSSSMA